MDNAIKFWAHDTSGNLIVPQFSAAGSKIEHPDLLPIFWGKSWPDLGNGITLPAVMNAVRSIITGPYLEGLKQYGYAGPVNLRYEMMVQDPPNINEPALGPGVSQSKAVNDAVRGFISTLVENERIDHADDNHDLLVAVFLDSSVPAPRDVNGANSTLEIKEFLDDNIRFQYLWVITADRSLDDVTATLSHELAEAISDPFGTGWTQTFPHPSPHSDQISDPCGQRGKLDGVTVESYWSNEDQACIIPTSGTRRISLFQSTLRHDPVSGPPQRGFVDLGKPLCAAGIFDYVETTYFNALTIHAEIQGYESPQALFSINGNSVPLYDGSIDVPASWEAEPLSPLSTLHPQPRKSHVTLRTSVLGPGAPDLGISAGPHEGNATFDVEVNVVESSDTAENGGKLETLKKAFLTVELHNQEIAWGDAYSNAKKQCDKNKHLANQLGVIIGPPRPGDPANLVARLTHAIAGDDSPESPDTAGMHSLESLISQYRPDMREKIQAINDAAQSAMQSDTVLRPRS